MMNIIAEIGSNWRTLNNCHESIGLAKECGATHVKFQLFTPNSLYGPAEKFDINQLGQTPYLHPHWLPHLAQQARSLGLEFMCSAFSCREYEIVNEYVNIHKIASAEITDTSILKKVNNFKKPVILSTGGSDLDEIRNALLYLVNCKVTIMYCVSDYPAKIIDFSFFKKIQQEFGDGYSYGYSDHSIDLINIPLLAKNSGATIFEKHVNLCGAVGTNDANHSCTVSEFKLYVDNLNDKKIDLFLESSKQMRSTWKRRFIATQTIVPGEKFNLNINCGIYRGKYTAQDPVMTFRHWDIENKVSKSRLNPGDIICYHNIDEELNV